jgi:Secretion system C-terminal sorting domain
MKKLLFVLSLIVHFNINAQCFFTDNPNNLGFTNQTKSESFTDTECKKTTCLIYPNPTTYFFTVLGDYTEGVLFGANGQFLRRVDVQKLVDISELAQGIYFLRLKNDVVKIVKL